MIRCFFLFSKCKKLKIFYRTPALVLHTQKKKNSKNELVVIMQYPMGGISLVDLEKIKKQKS